MWGDNLKKRRRFKIVAEMLKYPQIRRLLVRHNGEYAIEIIKLLEKYTQDEELAKVLGVKVSDVRAVLNRMYENGIVYYDREQDQESGWYYYHWNIDEKKFVEWVEDKLVKEAERFKNLLYQKEYYYCPSCGIEEMTAFEEAMDLQFRCKKCGTNLELLEEEVVDLYFPVKDRSIISLIEKAKKASKRKEKQKVN